MQFTGLKDKNKVEIYEDDIIKCLNNIIGVVKFGNHDAYCPVDNCYMDSVGFYVEVSGLPAMPMGPTEIYAEVIGNVYINLELLEKFK